MPERIWLIRAAKYLGMSPLELEALPPDWQAYAELMEEAENWVKQQQAKQAAAQSHGH